MLEINEQAPDFNLLDEDENPHSLVDYKGEWLIIYFYPKDDTPGCTKEACTIAEIYDEFSALGVSVIGVSKDSPKSHKKFKEKYSLPFILLSDESTEMLQAYGVQIEKSMFGKKYLGTARITYLVNPEGKIVKVYPKVSPANHALELLKDLKELV
jgi:peroxiredoxin Q/BCP